MAMAAWKVLSDGVVATMVKADFETDKLIRGGNNNGDW